MTILLAGMANSVFLQWIPIGVGRYLPDCDSNKDVQELLGTARLITLSVSIVIIFLSAAFHLLKNIIELSVIFFLIGALCASQAWYDLNLKIRNANLNPVVYGATLALKSALAFGVGAAAVLFGYGPAGAIVATIIANLAASLLSASVWRGVAWKGFNIQISKKLWSFGSPLIITFLLVFIIDASDRVFIDRILGAHAVGVYSAAYEISQYSVGSIASVINLAALPLVISLYSKGGFFAARNQLQKSFSFLLFVLAPVTAGLAVTSQNVACFFMGEKFSSEAAILIPWISMAMFFSCLKTCYFDYAFQLSSDTKPQVCSVAVGAVMNILFNYILIPKHGMVGAAIATVLAFFAALLVSIIIGRKVFCMPSIPWRDVVCIVFSTALMAIIISNLRFNENSVELFFKVVAGATIYILSCVLLNVMGCRKVVSRIKMLRNSRG